MSECEAEGYAPFLELMFPPLPLSRSGQLASSSSSRSLSLSLSLSPLSLSLSLSLSRARAYTQPQPLPTEGTRSLCRLRRESRAALHISTLI